MQEDWPSFTGSPAGRPYVTDARGMATNARIMAVMHDERNVSVGGVTPTYPTALAYEWLH